MPGDIAWKSEESRALPIVEDPIQMVGGRFGSGEAQLVGADVERRPLAVTRRLDFDEPVATGVVVGANVACLNSTAPLDRSFNFVRSRRL